MAKKLICLLLLIPIIVMISLFAATKSISITVDAPVSGLKIAEADSHIYLSRDKGESYTLDYTVYPLNAKNKTVTVSTEKTPDAEEAELDFDTSVPGKLKITPKQNGKIGRAKVYLTTAEGGFRQSVTVHVDSSTVTGIRCEFLKDGAPVTSLKVNETANIRTLFEPITPASIDLNYEVLTGSVSVDRFGTVKAWLSGRAEIKVSYKNLYYILTVDVEKENSTGTDNTENDTSITVNGKNEIFENAGTLYVALNGFNGFDEPKLTLNAYLTSDAERQSPIDADFEAVRGSDGTLTVSYVITEELSDGEEFVIVAEYDGIKQEFTVKKQMPDTENLNVSFVDNGSTVNEKYVDLSTVIPGYKIQLGIKIDPLSDSELKNCTYSAVSDNPAVVSGVLINKYTGNLSFDALKPGIATITAQVVYNGVSSAPATITVYVSPGNSFAIKSPAISFEEKYDDSETTAFDPHRFNRSSASIDDLITIGKWEYSQDGTLVFTENIDNHALKLNYLFKDYSASTQDSSFTNNLRWSVFKCDENGNVIYDGNGNPVFANEIYVANGTVSFNDQYDSFNGIVEIRLSFGSEINPKNSIYASYKLRCVSKAVNVYSYADLLRATTKNKDMSIVLRNHISRDFGYYTENGEVKPYYTTIQTTYDDQYYKNLYGDGTDEFKKQTAIKVLIEFNSNVYGNGHTVNAHNLTYGWDPMVDKQLSKDAIFRGPLSFVAMKGNGEFAGNAVSVKGQDNICFALYDGVTLNNVHLQGSSLSPDGDGNVDLDLLTYSGTVVEILGQSASIEYSRISNGRTVIRAFGEKYVAGTPTPKTTLDIKNSVLSGAREFILRTGSNRIIEGSYENPAPTITPENTEGYSAIDKAFKNEPYTTDVKKDYNGAGESGFTDSQRKYYDDNFINTFVNVENSVFRNTGLFAIGVDSHFASNALADGNRFVYNTNIGALSHFKLDRDKKTSLIDSWKGLAKTSYGAKVKFIGEVGLYTWKPLEDVKSDTLIEVPALSGSGAAGSSSSGFAYLVGILKFDVKNMIDNHISKDYPIVETNKETGIKYVHGGIAFFGGGKNYGVFDMTEAKSSGGSAYNIAGYSVGFDQLGDQFMLQYAAGSEPFFFYMFDTTDGSFKYNDQLICNDSSIINRKK